jgi:hypothetical protein
MQRPKFKPQYCQKNWLALFPSFSGLLSMVLMNEEGTNISDNNKWILLRYL